MSTQTRIADEYSAIRLRLEEIEREKKEAEKAKAPEHDYSAIYTGTYEDMVAWSNFPPPEEWVFNENTYTWVKSPCSANLTSKPISVSSYLENTKTEP